MTDRINLKYQRQDTNVKTKQLNTLIFLSLEATRTLN